MRRTELLSAQMLVSGSWKPRILLGRHTAESWKG